MRIPSAFHPWLQGYSSTQRTVQPRQIRGIVSAEVCFSPKLSLVCAASLMSGCTMPCTIPQARQAGKYMFVSHPGPALCFRRDHCLSASNSYADDQGSAQSEAQPAGGGGWSGPGFGAPRPQGMPQQATLFIPMGAQQPLGMQPMGYAGAGFPGTVGYGMQQPMQQGMRPMQPMQPMHGGVLYPPLPPGPPAYQQMSPGLPLGAQGSGAKPGAARFSSPGRALLQQQQQGAPGYGAGEGTQGQGAGAPRAPPGQGGPDRFQSPGRPPVPQWGGVAGVHALGVAVGGEGWHSLPVSRKKAYQRGMHAVIGDTRGSRVSFQLALTGT